MITRVFPGRIALISSFGAELVVLLHMVAAIDRATPVIFLNTGKLFGETLAYREKVVERFGLTDVRDIRPDPVDTARADPAGDLWNVDVSPVVVKTINPLTNRNNANFRFCRGAEWNVGSVEQGWSAEVPCAVVQVLCRVFDVSCFCRVFKSGFSTNILSRCN